MNIPVNLRAAAPKISRPCDWLGLFYGHDLNFLDCEVLALANVPAPLLKKESSLMGKKWFDYRRLHPTKATYLFAHYYVRAYQGFMMATFDVRGRYMRPFKELDVMQAHEKLAVWRLRQLVDDLGMRYDFFLQHAFKGYSHSGWFLKKMDKGSRAAPRPSHINANADLITNVMMQWEEECASRIQWPRDPRYKAENFFGHVDQLAWEDWLVGQIAQRRHPQYALQTALYIESALRIEKAVASFDERVVDEAVQPVQ